MSEEMLPESSSDSLINRYRAAQKRRNRARGTVGLISLLIIAVYISLMWLTFSDFRYNRLPEFGAELSAEAAEFMPGLAEEASQMTERLVPFYINTFAASFSGKEAEFREVISLEFKELETNAQRSWGKIEEANAQLAIDQEEAMFQALSEFITDEDIAKISEAYRKALDENLESIFSQYLSEHILVGERILTNLEEISTIETGVPSDNTQYILGMLMELLGLQMQEGSGDSYYSSNNSSI